MASDYVNTVEHRAAVYSLAGVPEMAEWRRQDFLSWLAGRDAETVTRTHNEIADFLESDRFETWNSGTRRPSGFKHAADRVRARGEHLATKARTE